MITLAPLSSAQLVDRRDPELAQPHDDRVAIVVPLAGPPMLHDA